MSNPQYQNNEGYDMPRVHNGFDKYNKPCPRSIDDLYKTIYDPPFNKPSVSNLDKTLPDRWRRWVHNPAWVDATPPYDPLLKWKLEEAQLKVQRWVINSDGSWEPYGEPVWPSTNKPVVKLRLKTDRIRKDLDDATIYAIQLMVMLDAARSPSLWQRIVGWFRYQFGI